MLAEKIAIVRLHENMGPGFHSLLFLFLGWGGLQPPVPRLDNLDVSGVCEQELGTPPTCGRDSTSSRGFHTINQCCWHQAILRWWATSARRDQVHWPHETYQRPVCLLISLIMMLKARHVVVCLNVMVAWLSRGKYLLTSGPWTLSYSWRYWQG